MNKPTVAVNWDDLAKEGKQYMLEKKPVNALTPAERKILSIIAANPGASFTEIRNAYGVLSGSISTTLSFLGQKGLVYKQRAGRYTCYFPNNKSK